MSRSQRCPSIGLCTHHLVWKLFSTSCFLLAILGSPVQPFKLKVEGSRSDMFFSGEQRTVESDV